MARRCYRLYFDSTPFLFIPFWVFAVKWWNSSEPDKRKQKKKKGAFAVAKWKLSGLQRWASGAKSRPVATGKKQQLSLPIKNERDVNPDR